MTPASRRGRLRDALRNLPLAASIGTRQVRDDPPKAVLSAVRLLPVGVRHAAAARASAVPPSARRRLPLLRAVVLLEGGRRADALQELTAAGADPTLPAGQRRRLAGLALAVDDVPSARALVAGLDEADPAAARLHAQLAAADGALTDAVRLTARPARPGLAGLRQDRAHRRLAGELAVLRPQSAVDLDGGGRRARAPGRPGAVLHLVSTSLPHRGTGYAVRTHEVVRHQRALGLDAIVATGLGFPVLQGVLAAAPVDEVDGIAYSRLLPRRSLPATRDRQLALATDLAAELVRRHRPAVLHAASPHLDGQLALRLRDRTGVPVVYEARGFLEETWLSRARDADERRDSDRYRLARAAETWTMRQADAVVTLSDGMRDAIVERGVPAERVSVVPNGVAERFLEPLPDAGDVREATGAAPSDLLVGVVSSLVPYEGVDVLVDALRLLADRAEPVRLIVVGDGTALPALHRQAERLRLTDRVTFTGRVPFAQVRRYHAAVDVVAVPRRDVRVTRLVTPLKPLEAMASGRPVVASDLPALAEVVAADRGVLVPPDDPTALADALSALAGDPVRRAALGTAGRSWVAAHRRWDRLVPRYLSVYAAVGAELPGATADLSSAVRPPRSRTPDR